MSATPRAAADLVLASASPRRLELLERVGLSVRVDAADVDETLLPGEVPSDYVVRVAADKAHAVASRHPGAVIIAADTAVVLDGEALGKPYDADDAAATLRRLADRSHDVLTAVVVIAPDGVEHTALTRATVTICALDDDEVGWYVDTGEPADKAGSYALQGLGAAFVQRVEGDPTTVIGLPLRTTLELVRTAGVSWPTRLPDVGSDDHR